MLAATATASGATALVSADSAFAEVSALVHIFTDSHGVDQLLAG